jgi:site-specific DNA-cytosine methylase
MRVRVVDLFCGCGGLSLGFELAGGPTTYDTVLGIDNDAVALRCYNDNFPSRSGRVPTGRQ